MGLDPLMTTALVTEAKKIWLMSGDDVTAAVACLSAEIEHNAALRTWIAEAAIEVVATCAFERAHGTDMGNA
jgi:hypothetical protein